MIRSMWELAQGPNDKEQGKMSKSMDQSRFFQNKILSSETSG